MRKIYMLLALAALPVMAWAAGWPANYGGVMLQGFYWDSYDDTYWPTLESQAGELSPYFSLVWIPQSGNCGGTSMGYDDLYWFSNYNSSFGNEQQLRSLITTFKSKGIGTIADVVINHRKTPSDWFTFPTETYNGVTYTMTAADICANDDGGATATQAAKQGVTLSGNNDTGEDWSGMRDLDHKSANVQTIVKAYLGFLLNDLGYTGFRYDMVKGYDGSFTGLYNSASQPAFSVGEYWDGNPDKVIDWLNATKVGGTIMSAAFDYPFRYTVRDAINKGNWASLSGTTLASQSAYRQYAVTFVENHDTEYRSSSAPQDPIKKDTLAANAYLLAMPGTPCVFLKHWQAYKQEIKGMIDARKLAGITNTSTYVNYKSAATYYAVKVNGDHCHLMAAVGPGVGAVTSSQYTEIMSGYHYKYFLEKTAETAWIDKADGEYSDAFDARLTAVSATSGATVVYTTDGTEPTASSTQVPSGATVHIDKACTLKAGLLKGGKVSGIVTRSYTFKAPDDFKPYTFNVYLEDPTASPNNWSAVYYYSWDSNSSAQQDGNWPGTAATATKVVKGTKFYYRTYTKTSRNYYINFVFNQGGATAGTHQTVDVQRVKGDAYFKVTTQTNKYEVEDVTSQYAGSAGDINGDGVVNVTDVTALINVILGTASYSDATCDLNGDGQVNVTDVTTLINVILAGN